MEGCPTLISAYHVQPSQPIHATVRPPGSKSITNRALVCAALAEGITSLHGALVSDDTEVMLDCLARLGITVTPSQEGTQLKVTGCGGAIAHADPVDLFVKNSGTTIRFLTAMTAIAHGTYRLDGIARMRERPIGDLLSGLRSLGVTCRGERENQFPPVVVEAQGLPGGQVAIRGDISSQYVSGLLLASPYAAAPTSITIEGLLVSIPYVEMTLQVMRAFGAQVDHSEYDTFLVDPTRRYQGRDFVIEPDASAASYFWAAAAITQGDITVTGLSRRSAQGDVMFCDCLAQMGCRVEYLDDAIRVVGRPLHGIEVDMNAISDTVQTLAAVALFAGGTTHIHNVGHIRHKETDRIGDLARELQKFGAIVDERDDGLSITPPHNISGATIATYDDHRMAMSMALVGLRIPEVVIDDPGCTAKTYPGFFRDLERITA